MTTLTPDEIKAAQKKPGFLFLHSKFVRNLNPNHGHYGYYDHTVVFVGDEVPLGDCLAGTEFTVDGRPAVLCGGQKNLQVRWRDSGMPGLITNTTIVKVTDRNTDVRKWGYPENGTFVKVLKSGDFQDWVGVVSKPGKHSTYVAFPDHPDGLVKFAAKDLQIVKARIEVA